MNMNKGAKSICRDYITLDRDHLRIPMSKTLFEMDHFIKESLENSKVRLCGYHLKPLNYSDYSMMKFPFDDEDKEQKFAYY